MRLILCLLAAAALASDKAGVFTLRDSLEHCKKLAYLNASNEPVKFEGEKSFSADPMEPGPASEIALTFLDDKLAKIVYTFKPELSKKEMWKQMIELRRKQHENLDACEAQGRDCWEWANDQAAERLVYDAEKPAITTTLIDRPAYKKAVYKKKKK